MSWRALHAALILFAGLLLAISARAQDAVPAAEAPAPQIALVTFGPGAIYWERFGHNALLVRDPVSGQAVLYNYGVFNFSQKNFFLNFARGRMQYWLAEQDFNDAIWQYSNEARWLRQQWLALEPAQARQLAAYLAWNAQPENAQYRYDYFVSNCSTRVRDALDLAFGGQLRPQLQAQQTPHSYRYEATRLIGPDRALALGMDLIMGPAGDQRLDRWQQSFVPMVLMDAIRQLRVRDASGNERPLVASERLILSSEQWPEPAQPPDWRAAFAVIGVGLALLLLALARGRSRASARYSFAALATVFSLVTAIVGVLMLAAWTLTEHWSMWSNRNLLLCNPLALLLVPAWIASARASWQPHRWQCLLGVLIAIGAVLSPLLLVLPGAQHNLSWILLLLPPQCALAWRLWRQRT